MSILLFIYIYIPCNEGGANMKDPVAGVRVAAVARRAPTAGALRLGAPRRARV